jgi:hypothetical protein
MFQATIFSSSVNSCLDYIFKNLIKTCMCSNIQCLAPGGLMGAIEPIRGSSRDLNSGNQMKNQRKQLKL